MNKANLKSYAPQARQDFIAAVSARASILGITAKGNSPIEVRGDVALIDGREWPKKVVAQRSALIERIELHGFQQVIEEVAYTWFNRFAALRFMEIHDYLDHGWRVLSSRDNGLPEILGHASELSLDGLNQAKAQEMQLAGNRDGELYRMLLVAQCNALNAAMPFLFERIDDDTELLLPDNLLRTDSVIAKLVQEIPEEDWAEVEIIGWLYQFYISEKKDQVIGKVVKSEDIPAATQLFTPNWIVQYLVQNSVGRLWLMANPASTLASQWPYYIQPAEQTPEVQAQLDALIQTRMDEDGGSLNPETITVLDPACGSGHILVVAYDVLKAIYLERGYQARAIPRLILEKNLYGMDIDDRAAQMAGFALLMKARADDRRLFVDPPKLNVLSLQESKGLDAAALAQALNSTNTVRTGLVEVQQLRWLIDTFEHAKTFGSLIQIGHQPLSKLRELLAIVQQALQAGDLYAQAAAQDVLPLVQQALVLGMQFDAVVANPPYIGRKYMSESLKDYLRDSYPGLDGDLFAAFIDRNLIFTNRSGSLGFMTPMVWMFISSHEQLRSKILSNSSISSLIQFEYNASGDVRVPLCIFTLLKPVIDSYTASFVRLSDFPGQDVQRQKTLEAIAYPNCGWRFTSKVSNFKKINGNPIAYWLGEDIYTILDQSPLINSACDARQGLSTGDTSRFIRFWHEVDLDGIAFDCNSSAEFEGTDANWAPYNKGGEFRKYYGNMDYVVLWKNSGTEVKAFVPKSVIRNEGYYFKDSLSWSDVTSSHTSFRLYPDGFVFDTVGHSAFFETEESKMAAVGYLNSPLIQKIIPAINPTLHFSGGYFLGLPRLKRLENSVFTSVVRQCVDLSIEDASASERSWDFSGYPFVCGDMRSKNLQSSWSNWEATLRERVSKLEFFESQLYAQICQQYGLDIGEFGIVPSDQITFLRPSEEKDCQRLVSYAIGCMMGRYSLDETGLIYAHAGNVGFDTSRYTSFPADADGIVPLTDELWFTDDAASRVREFLLAVWGADTLEENMAWLAESLGAKASETPDETIRRYLADKFFKDHLQTYKKRPIYWLFSSGKQGAFQALVYLHRYNEATLARMRSEYVVPLTSKFAYRLDMLEKDASASSSTAARTKIRKQIESLRKKQTELMAFEEKLRHYADMRIYIDLDDGVKVNYAKFGELLAESKAITGGADE